MDSWDRMATISEIDQRGFSPLDGIRASISTHTGSGTHVPVTSDFSHHTPHQYGQPGSRLFGGSGPQGHKILWSFSSTFLIALPTCTWHSKRTQDVKQVAYARFYCAIQKQRMERSVKIADRSTYGINRLLGIGRPCPPSRSPSCELLYVVIIVEEETACICNTKENLSHAGRRKRRP
jgi:hypothetical protein